MLCFMQPNVLSLWRRSKADLGITVPPLNRTKRQTKLRVAHLMLVNQFHFMDYCVSCRFLLRANVCHWVVPSLSWVQYVHEDFQVIASWFARTFLFLITFCQFHLPCVFSASSLWLDQACNDLISNWHYLALHAGFRWDPKQPNSCSIILFCASAAWTYSGQPKMECWREH